MASGVLTSKFRLVNWHYYENKMNYEMKLQTS